MNHDSRNEYTHPAGAAMVSAALAVGLYTEAFEGTIYMLRLAVQDHIKYSSDAVRGISEEVLDLRTNAYRTIEACRPREVVPVF